MIALTVKQQQLIVKNILAACRDIRKLNGTGYRFIYLAYGFIAHYNLMGFKDNYSDGTLSQDIKVCAHMNQYENFRHNEENAAYYQSKRDCYNLIIKGL
jgi:arginyl-tRNA--protein-N-Asp/Glu arginylyltransferase